VISEKISLALTYKQDLFNTSCFDGVSDTADKPSAHDEVHIISQGYSLTVVCFTISLSRLPRVESGRFYEFYDI